MKKFWWMCVGWYLFLALVMVSWAKMIKWGYRDSDYAGRVILKEFSWSGDDSFWTVHALMFIAWCVTSAVIKVAEWGVEHKRK